MNTQTYRLSTLALATLLTFGGAGLACAAGAASTPNNDNAMESDQPITDTWITTKVKSELATTEGVKSMDIDVKTVDGKVMLTGVLANDVAVQKAVAAAKSVKGVKTVDSSGLKSRN
ncbi:MAG TPA: BON domain-containing protein [Dokdonella sp.]|nr:BON domain-containing protein [Dokdonella sp.]